MSAGVEINNSVGRCRVATGLKLVARIQGKCSAAGNGAESVVESDRAGGRAMARRTSDIGAQVDETSERTTGEVKWIATGIES